MKILHINSVCGIRSTGRICTDLGMLLEKKGNIVKIGYGREKVPKEFKHMAVRVGTSFDVRCHAMYARLFDRAGFGSRLATKRFVEWIKEFNPDIIHLHNLHGYYINLEILFAYIKESDKKIIWTLHDCWPFTGHCSHFEYIECNKWISGCFDCEQIKEYPRSLFLDNSRLNYMNKKELFTGIKNMVIITPSLWLSKKVSKSFLGEYEIKVINNGIDLSVFKPQKGNFRNRYKLLDKTIILGVASTWDEKKGLNDFLKLSEMLFADQVIVMIGLTKFQCKNLPPNIIGIEQTNNIQELVEIYSEADIFFNPTYEDTYPTVNLEAQVCGTPVVSYDTGGSKESIPDENVIPKGAYRLVPQMANKKLKCKIKDFSKDTMLKKYEEIYYENTIYN